MKIPSAIFYVHRLYLNNNQDPFTYDQKGSQAGPLENEQLQCHYKTNPRSFYCSTASPFFASLVLVATLRLMTSTDQGPAKVLD